MERLTFCEPDGTCGVIGMNAENEHSKAYGCIMKLIAYENTGLEPDDITHLKNDKVRIGAEIQGYVIKVISNDYCFAERIKKVDCDDYVVWSIDNDKQGVNTGRYFSHWNPAFQKFIALVCGERGINFD